MILGQLRIWARSTTYAALPSTDHYHLILTQHYQVTISAALLRPSTIKHPSVPPNTDSATNYQTLFERISSSRSFINLTSYKFTSGVDFDQGYLSFFNIKDEPTKIKFNCARQTRGQEYLFHIDLDEQKFWTHFGECGLFQRGNLV